MCLLGVNSMAQNIYAVNNGSDQLVTLDPATLQPVGASVSMTDGGVAITGCNGLSVHPVCADIYIVYKMNGVTGRLLGIVDPATGVITPLGNTGDNVAGICFGDGDHLYAVTGDGATVPSTLFKMNQYTAVMTPFVTYGNGNDGESIAFNEDDGKIYHWSGNGINVMESTDTLTGVTTNIVESGAVHAEIFSATYVGAGQFLLSEISDVFLYIDVTGFAILGPTGVADYKGLGLPGIAPAPFTPTISTVDPTSFCPGDSATFTAPASAAYIWQLDGVTIPGATGSTYEAMSPGNLSALIASPIGCLGESNSVLIDLFQSPNVNLLPGDTSICPGDSILFIGANGGSLQWSLDGVPIAGANNDSLYVTLAGNYNQVKTNMSGCSDSSAVPLTLSYYQVPNVSLLPGDTSICPGDSVLFIGSMGGSSQWYLDGSIIPSGNNDSIYVSTPGSYNMTKTNMSGCSDSAAVGITLDFASVPVVNLSPSIDTSYCTGDSILITGATGGLLQWYMNGTMIVGATGSTYYVSSPGVYNQVKTNTSGCADSSAVGVTVIEDTDCDAGLNNLAFNGSVKLYPSPAEHQLTISLEAIITGRITITIYSTNGAVMNSSSFEAVNGSNEFVVATSALSSGMYLIEISQGGSKFVDRFVKK